MSLVGTVSFLKKRFIFIPWTSMLFSLDKFCSLHDSSKFAEQSDVYCQVGSQKSCLCLRANFTHFPLTVGIFRELKHSMCERCILRTLPVRGTNNTISPPRCRVSFYSPYILVKWYFGRAIRIPFLKGKWHDFESLYNRQF